MTFGEIRKEKGLTQADISHELNITQSTVAMWETGKSVPTAAKLMALSQLLGVSADELYRSFPKSSEV